MLRPPLHRSDAEPKSPLACSPRYIAAAARRLLVVGSDGDGDEAQPATGSIETPIEVPQPLPQTLAYSDATKIGQAATAALWQATGRQAKSGSNAATGSSGTLERAADGDASSAEGCRSFSTIVTSIGGVHRYAGQLCRSRPGWPLGRADGALRRRRAGS